MYRTEEIVKKIIGYLRLNDDYNMGEPPDCGGPIRMIESLIIYNRI